MSNQRSLFIFIDLLLRKLLIGELKVFGWGQFDVVSNADAASEAALRLVTTQTLPPPVYIAHQPTYFTWRRFLARIRGSPRGKGCSTLGPGTEDPVLIRIMNLFSKPCLAVPSCAASDKVPALRHVYCDTDKCFLEAVQRTRWLEE